MPNRPRTLSAQLQILTESYPVDSRFEKGCRARGFDVLAIVVAAAMGAIGVIDSDHQRGLTASSVLIDVCLGVIAISALWWRRRQPVVVALFTVVMAVFSATAGATVLITLYTVSSRRPLRTAIGIGVLGMASGVAYYLLNPGGNDSLSTIALYSLIVFAVLVAWGQFSRAQRHVVATRADRAESEQQLRVVRAREQERSRIAREMHDVLGHRLSMLSLHAGALEVSQNASPEVVAKSAAAIRENAHRALEDLRQVIGVLRERPEQDGDAEGEGKLEGRGSVRDLTLAPQPSLADVSELLEESRAGGMRLEVDSHVELEQQVPEAEGRAAYRVLQEGLTNSRKHAPHALVQVLLRASRGNGIEIEIRNPVGLGGSRVAQSPESGMGLVGLAERVALSGGRLEHGRTEGGEYRLWAWLPWTEESEVTS